MLASGLEKGAPIVESTLTAILTSSLWIGMVTGAVLVIFAGRIRSALSHEPSAK
jgi:hypothetical protein